MNKARTEVLPCGLRVILVPCEAESAAAGVFVANGSRWESAKEAGVSHFIEHMLFKGTPTRKPADITRAIEGRGGNFNAFTGEESTCYYAHVPGEYLGEAFHENAFSATPSASRSSNAPAITRSVLSAR